VGAHAARAKARRPRGVGDVPSQSPVSDALSAQLKKRGFRFVGSTIIYAFMQASGMVNDHVATCFRAKISTKTSTKTSTK
jgi:DNA-3-methyladenine glycosylase I